MTLVYTLCGKRKLYPYFFLDQFSRTVTWFISILQKWPVRFIRTLCTHHLIVDIFQSFVVIVLNAQIVPFLAKKLIQVGSWVFLMGASSLLCFCVCVKMFQDHLRHIWNPLFLQGVLVSLVREDIYRPQSVLGGSYSNRVDHCWGPFW